MKTKIISLEELARRSAEMRRRGEQLVLTNGCFDLLHVGHVRYLEAARELGDALAVAVNSDESVRVLKGDNRPINSAADRAEILSALASVDFVVIFETTRATLVIEAISPSIYVKGGDYTVERLHPEEKEAIEKIGAIVKILPFVPDKSTSALLSRLRGS